MISGRVAGKVDRPLPVRNVVVQDNTFTGCAQSVFLTGAVSRTLVVGNRITDAQFTAVDLVDLSPTAADILIANNTICDCKLGLRVWDDHSLGKSFLKCKNIRFENNLLLSLGAEGDLVFSDHTLGVVTNARPGDLEGFLKAPGWKLGHNWREIDGEQAETSGGGLWIPLRPGDKLWRPIAVQSREPGAVGYLRPAMDSPLAYGGAGGELPPYVGAVPPEGAEAWGWEKTWKGLGK